MNADIERRSSDGSPASLRLTQCVCSQVDDYSLEGTLTGPFVFAANMFAFVLVVRPFSAAAHRCNHCMCLSAEEPHVCKTQSS